MKIYTWEWKDQNTCFYILFVRQVNLPNIDGDVIQSTYSEVLNP